MVNRVGGVATTAVTHVASSSSGALRAASAPGRSPGLPGSARINPSSTWTGLWNGLKRRC